MEKGACGYGRLSEPALRYQPVCWDRWVRPCLEAAGLGPCCVENGFGLSRRSPQRPCPIQSSQGSRQSRPEELLEPRTPPGGEVDLVAGGHRASRSQIRAYWSTGIPSAGRHSSSTSVISFRVGKELPATSVPVGKCVWARYEGKTRGLTVPPPAIREINGKEKVSVHFRPSY